MIDSIKDILRNIKDRFSSPFFFSFLISWLIYNWKVTIMLLWYNPELYPNQGDLIACIETQLSRSQSLWWPLISAFTYTAFARIIISALTELTSMLGESLNLQINKKGKVPMSKFINYRNLYNEATKNLEIILADETKTKENFDNLKSSNLKLDIEKNELNSKLTDITFEKNELENKISTLNNTISQLEMNATIRNAENDLGSKLLNSYKDISILNGQWKFTYQNAQQKLTFQQTLEIIDGTISIVNGSRKEESYKITFFFNDTVSKKLYLHLKFIPEILTGKYSPLDINPSTLMAQILEDKYKSPNRLNSQIFLFHELQVKDENQFTGTENLFALIQYKRI